MNRCFKLLIIISLPFTINAQTWFGAGGTIPDDGTPVMFPVNISNLLPSTIDTIHGLAGIGLNLTHPYDADLLIALVAPDGTSVILSNGNGWDGDNYTGTHFTDTASLSIAQGFPPFTGFYRPQEMLGWMNNGREGNGTWYLYILDMYAWADQGYLANWSITFGDNPTGPFLFTSSNLPIVLIDTYGQDIPDDPKIQVGMKVIDNGPGQRNYITDTPVYDAYAGIEIRGSSSQMFPKKSYGFETWDESGEELKVSLLGMPEETDWILNANYTDKTFCRNTLAYKVSWNMGHYSTRHEHVEVVINGIYKGVYIFSEKIKRDANRVDIAKLKPDENSGDPLTGGYIFKIDKPTGSGGGEGWESDFPPPANPDRSIFFQYEYPKADEITLQQKEYISDYVNTFETTLAGPDFDDPENGFRKYADEGTFIDYFIVNEISKNVDGYRLSTFLYKERESLGGKLRIGPVWDYDIAWHNANYYGGEEYTGWSYEFPYPDDNWQVPFWWSRMLEDSTFANNLKCRWTFLRDDLLSDAWFDQYIDSIAQVLDESQQRNFTIWPILGTYVWPNPWPYPQTYAEEISVLKNWIHQRMSWLDANLPGTCYSVGTEQLVEDQTGLSVFPNPAWNSISVFYTSKSTQDVFLSISDPSGRVFLLETVNFSPDGKIEWRPDITRLKPGIWFISVYDGLFRKTERFVKF
ncbi:MAG: CotH kinase family protein [Bacteroidales bacterium]|nr:CotH kinase family protein [Bacteroidales bacterium]